MRRSAQIQHLLADIIFWGERLQGHIEGLTEAEFIANGMTVDSACWCISCIGEAAGVLLRNYPELTELKLGEAYAMRNRLTHGYFSVDQGIVWAVCQASVPEIIEAARNHLNANTLP
jgi:uncharacterized protein with HEPN domain